MSESNKPQLLDILIATNNKFKIEEMEWLLDGVPNVKLRYLNEIKDVPEIEEDGETLLENASKKAKVISKHTNWMVFTSDAGIKIPGLKDKWDYRKPQRILGVKASASEKIGKLMKMMSGLKGGEREAQYILAIALARGGKVIFGDEFTGYEGSIIEPGLIRKGRLEAVRGMSRMWYLKNYSKTEEMLTNNERSALREQYQTESRKKLQAFIRSLVL